MSIIRQWLSHCDSQHACGVSLANQLPTRLIDVGSGVDSTVRLYEPMSSDSLNYVALSHLWGRPPCFYTFVDNVDHYRSNIPFETLPKTYQHAIWVTRELHIRYLWIDSICVIQGPQGDFSAEKNRTEDILSQAYCVIAASSASGQNDGFLQTRQKFESIRLKPPSNEAVICVTKFIDDFDRYVLQSPLHRNARSLEERAFARRTIYFTSAQTFWECGSGVRCETMTKMYK